GGTLHELLGGFWLGTPRRTGLSVRRWVACGGRRRLPAFTQFLPLQHPPFQSPRPVVNQRFQFGLSESVVGVFLDKFLLMLNLFVNDLGLHVHIVGFLLLLPLLLCRRCGVLLILARLLP